MPRSATPASPIRARVAHFGTKAVRFRAGDAGRPEGADHSRAVHTPVAAVSVRSKRACTLHRARRSRPDRDDGARKPCRAARCSRGPTARSAARCDRHGKCCRRHVQGDGAGGMPEPRSFPGLDRCGRRRRGRDAPRCRVRSASTSDTHRGIERRLSTDRICATRWAEIAARSSRQQDRSRPGAGARGAASRHGPGRRISRYILYRPIAPRKIVVTKRSETTRLFGRRFDADTTASGP